MKRDARGRVFVIVTLIPACLCLLSCAALAGEAAEIIPPELRGATQPQAAMQGPDVWVTFGRQKSVWVTRSADGGKSFQPPVKVTDLPQLALGLRRGPRIVANAQGVVVTAISEGELLAWRSGDGGKTWGVSRRINEVAKSAAEGMHGFTAGRDLMFVLWLDLRNQQSEVWGAASRDGGRTWELNARVYRSPDGHVCECCPPTAAVGADGRVWAMWRNWLAGARDMFLTVSRDGARTFEPAQKLGAGTWPLNACPMDGGGLDADTSDGAVTVWRRDRRLFLSRPGGEERLLGEGSQPVVATSAKGAFVAWQQDGGIRLATSDREMKGWSDAMIVSSTGAWPVIAASPSAPTAVVVWEQAVAGNPSLFARVIP